MPEEKNASNFHLLQIVGFFPKLITVVCAY